MTPTIRSVRAEELDAVGELTVRAFIEGGHMSPDAEYVRVLRAAAERAVKAEILVAVEGDKLLGSVTIAGHGGAYSNMARPGELEFRMLAVAPEATGRGTGRALVQAVIDRARTGGFERIVLCSQESMTAAHRIYRDFGFERAADRDWFPEPELRLLAFSRDL